MTEQVILERETYDDLITEQQIKIEQDSTIKELNAKIDELKSQIIKLSNLDNIHTIEKTIVNSFEVDHYKAGQTLHYTLGSNETVTRSNLKTLIQDSIKPIQTINVEHKGSILISNAKKLIKQELRKKILPDLVEELDLLNQKFEATNKEKGQLTLINKEKQLEIDNLQKTLKQDLTRVEALNSLITKLYDEQVRWSNELYPKVKFINFKFRTINSKLQYLNTTHNTINFNNIIAICQLFRFNLKNSDSK